jgi:hypothetical protein
MAYQPQPSDVFIAPYAKCGSAWLQQIVHGLRTRSDVNHVDLTQVMPWLEMAYYAGMRLDVPQPGGFRAFKSHLSWANIPKGGRYIVSFRDPKDALVSFYDFVNGYDWQADSVSMAEFARAQYLNYQGDRWEGSYWGHLVSWWEQRHNPTVLLLCYEGMKADVPATAAAIALFLGIGLDRVLSNAELESPVQVKPGPAGEHRTELPAEIGAEMDAIWRETVERRTGLASYQALRAALVEQLHPRRRRHDELPAPTRTPYSRMVD